jgi:signal transduction histidine kinase
VNWLRGRRPPAVPAAPAAHPDAQRTSARLRALVAETTDAVVIVDDSDRIVALSEPARAAFPELGPGAELPASLLAADGERAPRVVAYAAAGGRDERLVFLPARDPDAARYEELRIGFTAVVSHELRTPLARQLALLDAALLPGEDTEELIEQARAEVTHMRDLIDEVLFLSALETGSEVVSLGHTPALPVLRAVAAELAASADRAGVQVRVEGDEDVVVPLRPRMVRVLVENLTENAIRYAGPGATFTLSARRAGDGVSLDAVDDGVGVPPEHLERLFERFYRADQARTSRGTGLGLAIVKHIVTAAGGTVEATSEPGGGLAVRCRFPAV